MPAFSTFRFDHLFRSLERTVRSRGGEAGWGIGTLKLERPASTSMHTNFVRRENTVRKGSAVLLLGPISSSLLEPLHSRRAAGYKAVEADNKARDHLILRRELQRTAEVPLGPDQQNRPRGWRSPLAPRLALDGRTRRRLLELWRCRLPPSAVAVAVTAPMANGRPLCLLRSEEGKTPPEPAAPSARSVCRRRSSPPAPLTLFHGKQPTSLTWGVGLKG